jgi:DNA helicase-2/ATP-dependent DNA helicase PcrA
MIEKDHAAPPYAQGLNPEQQAAVSHFEGPILVLAGAGSGKTRVLTVRICHLIQHHGVPPERILAVTFTNKAAQEMRTRIRRALGTEPAGMWMGTFHSMGARLLRRHAPQLGWSHTFTILDAEQSLRQIKRTTEAVGLDPKRWSPKAIRAQISGAKNQLVGPQDFAADNGDSFDVFVRNVAKVYPRYQRSLKDQNAFDFDDLLVRPVELLQQDERLLERYRERFAFVLVDEYQDTNRAQFRFVELLAGEHRNLMVVGDDDQSIYGWRGADIRNILDFEQAFPGAATVRLEQNYRSTERILAAANAVIALNLRRKGKTLRTERVGGETITLVETGDETDEAGWIVEEILERFQDRPDRSYRRFSVLYRTNAQSRALEDAFRRRGVPYQVVGGVRFYERREIQDVLAYLRLISNPKDAEAFDRVVNYPRRGVGATSMGHVRGWAESEDLTLLEAAARSSEIAGLRTAAARGLDGVASLIQRYSARAARQRVGDLLTDLIEELELVRHLRAEGPEGEDRIENVKELIAGALDFDAELMEDWDEGERDRFTELDLFLQQVALVADVDRHDPDADAVVLMTLHNAKGLEFPSVFIAGLEDGLFPLSRAFEEPEQLEEERRLFYVGLTRAEDKLYLTHARRRRRAGEYMYGGLSSFVEAIPADLLEKRKSLRLRARDTASEAYRTRVPARTEAARRPMADFDPDLDFSLNQDLPRFVKGERVVHATFGEGSIVDVSGFGRDLKLLVEFDEVGRKKLLARYAGLERPFD